MWFILFIELFHKTFLASRKVKQVIYFRALKLNKRLRWSRGSVLAFGTQVRGFKPGRSRRIFKGK